MKYVLVLISLTFTTPVFAQSLSDTAPILRIMLASEDKLEHVGFYVALHKGYYKAKNVDVRFSTPQTQDPLNKLEYGEVDLAIETLPMALQKNQKTRNLCLVKQIMNSPGIALVSQSPTVDNIMKFEDQTLFHSTASDYLSTRIWLSTEGLSVEGEKAKVQFRRYSFILRDFTTGKISHAVVPESWLPLLYNKISGQLKVFTPAFVKGATLGAGLYATRKKYNNLEFKALAARFLEALDQGFKDAFADKKKAVDLTLTEKEKNYSDEVLMKRLSILETSYLDQASFAKHYEHSLQNIMDVEAVSEIKEYPRSDFLAISEAN